MVESAPKKEAEHNKTSLREMQALSRSSSLRKRATGPHTPLDLAAAEPPPKRSMHRYQLLVECQCPCCAGVQAHCLPLPLLPPPPLLSLLLLGDGCPMRCLGLTRCCCAASASQVAS